VKPLAGSHIVKVHLPLEQSARQLGSRSGCHIDSNLTAAVHRSTRKTLNPATVGKFELAALIGHFRSLRARRRSGVHCLTQGLACQVPGAVVSAASFPRRNRPSVPVHSAVQGPSFAATLVN